MAAKAELQRAEHAHVQARDALEDLITQKEAARGRQPTNGISGPLAFDEFGKSLTHSALSEPMGPELPGQRRRSWDVLGAPGARASEVADGGESWSEDVDTSEVAASAQRPFVKPMLDAPAAAPQAALDNPCVCFQCHITPAATATTAIRCRSEVAQESSVPIELNSILEMSWSEYDHALHVQLCWWQVHWHETWPSARISLDERHDNSWVNVIRLFRQLKQERLERLSAEQRNVLVGTSDEEQSPYFFGSLRAAGTVTQTLRDPTTNPSAVATIEAARKKARRLGYLRVKLRHAVDPWASIAELHDFGPASASRLMLAERPDLYFMLNQASRRGMEIITEHGLPQLLVMPSVANHYRKMLKRIYRAPWCREAPPANSRDLFIWSQRVALLDVFAYDEHGARFTA